MLLLPNKLLLALLGEAGLLLILVLLPLLLDALLPFLVSLPLSLLAALLLLFVLALLLLGALLLLILIPLLLLLLPFILALRLLFLLRLRLLLLLVLLLGVLLLLVLALLLGVLLVLVLPLLFILFIFVFLLLCVNRSSDPEKQEQNSCTGKSDSVHLSIPQSSVLGRPVWPARCSVAESYLSDMFLGDFLFRVPRSNFAEAGGRIALLITMSFAVVPLP